MKKIFVSLFFVLSLTGFITNYAQAQDGAEGFSVNPFFQDVALEKDQAEKAFKVEIGNNTENTVVLKLSTLDFGVLDESGGVAFVGSAENLTNKYALASWISLDKDALVLNPGEKQSVRVTIQNKESLSPGGHYAAIMAKVDLSGDNNNGGSSEVALEPSFSSLIFVRKLGGEIYGLDLRDKEIAKSILGMPTAVRLRFQNTGNVHVAPRGIVTLSDPIGRMVKKAIINQDSGLILPESFRVFPTNLQEIAPAFIPGRYNLSVDYRFDGKEDFTIEQQSIFIIPAIDILALLIVIAAGYVLVKIRRRRK